MPPQSGKGGLFGKYGDRLKKAFDAHKNDETEYGQSELPAGIEGGIAQLVECKFDTYKKGDFTGEYYFYAAGVVKSPVEFVDAAGNKHRLEGQRTSIMEAVCDTPGRSRESVDDHVKWILNEMRKLGVDVRELGVNDLEATAAALKESAPHFRFRTWKGDATKEFPNPRTNHQWNGMVSYGEEDADASAGVEDATEAAPAKPTTPATKPAASGAKPPAKKPPAGGKTVAKAPEPEPVEESNDPEFNDLASLAKRADKGDSDAQDELTRLAAEAGVDDTDVSQADSWDAVADMIRGKGEGGEEEPEPDEEAAAPEEEEWAPKVEEVYGFRPVDPKTKKKAAKPVEVEVVAVDAKLKQVQLKNLTNPKIRYTAKFDDLESAG